jgi:arylsulfatase A-like enzyme
LPFAGRGGHHKNWVPPLAQDRDFVTAAYDEEIRYLDGQLNRLLNGIAQRGLSEETLVFLISDHGEELYDHGSFEHGHSMYDEVLRVPLLVLGPGVAARRFDTPVSVMDLFPTILEALELEIPPATAGRSLWPMLVGAQSEIAEDRPLIAEAILHGSPQRALVRWPWKVVVGASEKPRLFNLADDPTEKIDLAAREPRQLGALLQELASVGRKTRSQRAGQPSVPLDRETRRQLEGLGYLEERGGGPTE